MALTSRHLLWLVLFCLLLSISANVYQYRSSASDREHTTVDKNRKDSLPETTTMDSPVPTDGQEQEHDSIHF